MPMGAMEIWNCKCDQIRKIPIWKYKTYFPSTCPTGKLLQQFNSITEVKDITGFDDLGMRDYAKARRKIL